MRYKMVVLVALAGVMVFSQGCASLLNQNRPVSITSQPSGASITITDKKGKAVFEGTTPTTVTLKRNAGYFSAPKYTVEFKKAGCPDCPPAKVKCTLSPWYWGGNLIFGGLIGYLVVDPLTGAMWTLKDLHVDLQSPPSAQVEDTLRIMALDQVPQELRPNLVRIN